MDDEAADSIQVRQGNGCWDCGCFLLCAGMDPETVPFKQLSFLVLAIVSKRLVDYDDFLI